MRLTLVCLLFIAICMTVSARNPYGKANKDKKYFGYISTGYSVYRAARRVRWGRWGEKRG